MSWAEDVMAAQNRALAQALPGVQAALAQAAIARLTAAIDADLSAELAASDQIRAERDQATIRATDAEAARDQAIADLTAAETQIEALIAVVQGATPAAVPDGQALPDAPPTV